MKITEEQLELLFKRPDVIGGYVLCHTDEDIVISFFCNSDIDLHIPINSFDFKDLDYIELNVATREITNLSR